MLMEGIWKVEMRHEKKFCRWGGGRGGIFFAGE